MRVEESPVFTELRQAAAVERAPLVEAFRTSKRAMVVFFGYAITNAVGFYLLAGYMQSYLTGVVKLPPRQASFAYLIALVVFAGSSRVGGEFADRFGRKPTALVACLGVLLVAVPSFLLLRQGSFIFAILGEALFGLFLGVVSVMSSVLVVEMFPPSVRYSAGSLPYNLCYTAFGGSAPYVATALVAHTGSQLAPAYYLLIMAAISSAVVAFALHASSLPGSTAQASTNHDRPPRRPVKAAPLT